MQFSGNSSVGPGAVLGDLHAEVSQNNLNLTSLHFLPADLTPRWRRRIYPARAVGCLRSSFATSSGAASGNRHPVVMAKSPELSGTLGNGATVLARATSPRFLGNEASCAPAGTATGRGFPVVAMVGAAGLGPATFAL